MYEQIEVFENHVQFNQVTPNQVTVTTIALESIVGITRKHESGEFFQLMLMLSSGARFDANVKPEAYAELMMRWRDYA